MATGKKKKKKVKPNTVSLCRVALLPFEFGGDWDMMSLLSTHSHSYLSLRELFRPRYAPSLQSISKAEQATHPWPIWLISVLPLTVKCLPGFRISVIYSEVFAPWFMKPALAWSYSISSSLQVFSAWDLSCLNQTHLKTTFVFLDQSSVTRGISLLQQLIIITN